MLILLPLILITAHQDVCAQTHLQKADLMSAKGLALTGGGFVIFVKAWTTLHSIARHVGKDREYLDGKVVGTVSGGGWAMQAMLFNADVMNSFSEDENLPSIVNQTYAKMIRRVFGDPHISRIFEYASSKATEAEQQYRKCLLGDILVSADLLELSYGSSEDQWSEMLSLAFKDHTMNPDVNLKWYSQIALMTSSIYTMRPKGYIQNQTIFSDFANFPLYLIVQSDRRSTAGNVTTAIEFPHKTDFAMTRDTYLIKKRPFRHDKLIRVNETVHLHSPKEVADSILKTLNSTTFAGPSSAAIAELGWKKLDKNGYFDNEDPRLFEMEKLVMGKTWRGADFPGKLSGVSLGDGGFVEGTGLGATIYGMQKDNISKGTIVLFLNTGLISVERLFENYEGVYAGLPPYPRIFKGQFPDMQCALVQKTDTVSLYVLDVTTILDENYGIKPNSEFKLLVFDISDCACGDQWLFQLPGRHDAPRYSRCSQLMKDDMKTILHHSFPDI